MARAKMPKNVSQLLERLLKNHKRPTISVEDLLNALGQRAYDPLLFIAGLVLISPIGGLPGATAVLGSFIVLVAAQSLFVDTPWLPKWLLRRSASTAKPENG